MRSKTQIFKSYDEFLDRPYKSVNGMSEHVLNLIKNKNKDYDFEEDNITNTGCWNCFDCTNLNGGFACIEFEMFEV